jgi:hypothetical protein
MRIFAVLGAGLSLVALLVGALPAAAQEAGSAGAPLDAAESALLGQALRFDPASLAGAPAKPLSQPGLPAAKLDVSGNDKADGSGTIAIKQPLPTAWDAKVGVDLGLAAPPAESYAPGAPLPGSRSANSGDAWASMGLPNLASVDARIDPGSEQGRLGTTLQHSVPLGGSFSLALHDSLAVSDALGPPEPSAPAGLPVMALPRAAASAAAEPIWSNRPGVKLNILPTGTTLLADLAAASNDPVIHNTLSADQKLYGPLHVTTSISDIGEATVNKSITAGLKFNW